MTQHNKAAPPRDTLHAYEHLTPDVVLDALASVGLSGDGRMMALSSYENRVYQAHLESPVGSGDLAGETVVVKFYRPDRWSDAQILEEHAFVFELAEREIPVVAPTPIEGKTLLAHNGFRFAVFPRRGGRAPELEDPKILEWMGRFLGRIHAVGAISNFAVRASDSRADPPWPLLKRSANSLITPAAIR